MNLLQPDNGEVGEQPLWSIRRPHDVGICDVAEPLMGKKELVEKLRASSGRIEDEDALGILRRRFGGHGHR